MLAFVAIAFLAVQLVALLLVIGLCRAAERPLAARRRETDVVESKPQRSRSVAAQSHPPGEQIPHLSEKKIPQMS